MWLDAGRFAAMSRTRSVVQVFSISKSGMSQNTGLVGLSWERETDKVVYWRKGQAIIGRQ